MPRFKLSQLPPHVNTQQLIEKIRLLTECKVYSDSEEEVTLTYLGGITNHGLKDESRGLFIRIPGADSDHLVDREAELDTLRQLAEVGMYPLIIEAYSEGELKGYKIEFFIDGETLQFADFSQHQFAVLPILKELHDSKLVLINEFNIFDRFILMYETLVAHDVEFLPLLSHGEIENIPIEDIKSYIDELKESKERLFPYHVVLSPCHNDITPTNFIKLKTQINGRKYQMIDWEYAGMNDKMYDLASIAAMLGLVPDEQTQLVLNYFNNSHAQQYDEEIKRVKFYVPLVKLYYSLWSTLQVCMCNESSSILELRNGWGPGSLSTFLEQYHSESYQELISNPLRHKSYCS